MCLKKQKEK
jgi:hypothetical protein